MHLNELRALGSRIKVIVCDLDQTLLNSQKLISPTNLQALRLAQKQGIFVTISSGRIFTMLEAYERELGIQGPFISTNGAAVVNSPDHRLLWSRPIERESAFEIIDYARSREFDYSVLTSGACYFSTNSRRIQWFIRYNEIASARGLTPIPLVYMNGSNQIVKEDVFKMLIHDPRLEIIQEAYDYISQFKGIDCTSSEQGLLDVLSSGVNKGRGLAELKSILGVAKEQVCVFGDYLNDLPMFEEAGFPIAMANGHDLLKQKALAITDSHDEDGVAKAIHAYIL